MGDTQKLSPDEQIRSAFEAYENGKDFTVAVEEEFALLDPSTLELVNRFEEVQRAAQGTELGKARSDAAHSLRPKALATVNTSLSPRPERPSTINLSAASFGAMRITCAMAWADSKAGMMPSKRQVS